MADSLLRDLRVEWRALASLIPDPRNARRHSEAQLAAIAGSLKEFGWIVPLIIQSDGQLIAGHGRVQAAQLLGETKAPCILADHLTPAQRRAYVLADNRLAELATWDDELLKLELGELKGLGFDLEPIGFDDAALADLGFGIEPLNGDPDEVPDEPDEADVYVRPGELYLLGNHRLLCGDATKPEDVRRVLDGHLADLCWTDPPWNVAYGSSDHPSYRKRQIANDDLGEKFPAFCAAFCTSVKAATKPGAALYMAMSAQEWPTIDGALRTAGFHWSATVIWAKDSLVLGRGDYHRQYEPLWYGWNADAPRLHPLEDRKQSDLWEIPRPKRSEEHPTMKPVELVARAVQNSSSHGSLVLEPFSGSGTTLVACEQTGRACAAIELEPRYVQVAIARWESLTGRKAVSASQP